MATEAAKAVVAVADSGVVIVQAKTALQNGLNPLVLKEFHRQSRELSACNDLSRLVSGGPY